MAQRTVHPQLPLLLADVPSRVRQWLRHAGVPVAPWQPEEAPARAWTPFTRWTGHEFPGGRFVLYDSRRDAGGPDVRLCQRFGVTRVDIARLICRVPVGCAAGPFANPTLSTIISDAPAQDNPERSTFLDRLKGVVEKNNGLWARVADYPFPHRCVLCLDGELPGGELLPSGQSDGLEARVTRRYLAGLPMNLALPSSSEPRTAAPLTAQNFPLMWQTTRDEFSTWWQQRDRVRVRIWQTEKHYRVDCQHLPTDRLAVLELWRGGHVAALPLSSGTMIVALGGLVFQRQAQRHPAGFTSWWPDHIGDAA